MNMKEILTRWNPWHLRRRVKELEESHDLFTEMRNDLIDECREYIIKENERLKKENEDLKLENNRMNTVMHAKALQLREMANSLFALWSYLYSEMRFGENEPTN